VDVGRNKSKNKGVEDIKAGFRRGEFRTGGWVWEKCSFRDRLGFHVGLSRKKNCWSQKEALAKGSRESDDIRGKICF